MAHPVIRALARAVWSPRGIYPCSLINCNLLCLVIHEFSLSSVGFRCSDKETAGLGLLSESKRMLARER